ncbi:DUF5677 domain-containing protein [Spirosoma endophyticum]|uniref:Uncharacterized protein n=1 Tax=Spirosoma endophyticum TaxID=662367 RepID=A0A1I2H318_9BACT|nr:DUF5677 domain-containing protein [Spirosoma endophyticum]SFF24634.1 hypothetical protein SAMN05216167_1386 [Spirosoma endophyticum]
MPHKKTEPVPSILSREIEEADIIEAIGLYTEGLDEFVNFGTQIIDWELKRDEMKQLDVVVISKFRNILELADAISVLLKQGAVDPCKIVLRTLFEITLGLEYVLQNDSDRRALCYRFFGFNRQLTLDKRHDPQNSNYKTYQEEYKYGHVFQGVPEITNLKERIDFLQGWIDRPEHAVVKAEFHQVKKSSHEWFTPFSELSNMDSNGNPKLLRGIKDLAKYLHKFDLYEILYKDWSTSVHGLDTITGTFFRSGEDGLSMLALRQPLIAHEVTNITFRFVESALSLMTKRNMDKFGEIIWWYKSFDINYLKPIFTKTLSFTLPT